MAALARLKNEFTENKKFLNLMIWLKCYFVYYRRWNKETCESVFTFQDLEDLEVKRLQTLRNKLWKGTNIDSLTAVKHDEVCIDNHLLISMCC